MSNKKDTTHILIGVRNPPDRWEILGAYRPDRRGLGAAKRAVTALRRNDTNPRAWSRFRIEMWSGSDFRVVSIIDCSDPLSLGTVVPTVEPADTGPAVAEPSGA